MTTTIVVLTCARDAAAPWPYLSRTLDAIDVEDLPGCEKLVVVDGELPTFAADYPAWQWIAFKPEASRLKGNKLPYWHCLEVADARDRDALIFEDDLAFAHNAVRRMVTLPVPADLAWLQFFAPNVLQTGKMMPGIWRPPAIAYSFSQAMKYTARTLATLVEWRATDREFQKFNESDNALGLAAQRLGLRYGVHSPDLVQHVGETSKANPDDELSPARVSKMWPGPNFDAMTLYARDDIFR